MSAKKLKLALLASGCILLLAMYTVGWSGKAKGSRAHENAKPVPDAERITNLLAEMERADLDSLPALEIPRFQIPNASVDVMRVRLEETYDIAGVGKDTVELRGWIAVMHDNPRPAPGETEVRWGTAVSDTQFVGMDLRGESKIFGPVIITLNPDLPSKGQVGKLSLPENEMSALHKAYLAATGGGQEDLQRRRGGYDTVPRIRGYEGASRTFQAVISAIESQDPQAMLRQYDQSPGNTFFNAGTGKVFRGARSYINFLAAQFTKVKFDVKVSDFRLIQGSPGRWAIVEVVGTNIVSADREGRSGGEAPFHLTQVYVNSRGRWLIKYDSFAVAQDPNSLNLQGAGNAAACRAEAAISINMPKLDLRMQTKSPVVWYSEVETIPPVGETASISFTPTPVISDGRVVGTLTSGVVKFREVVRKVELIGTK